jgi:hypothetical protein
MERMSIELCKEFDKLNLRIVTNTEVVAMESDSTLSQETHKGQLKDESRRSSTTSKKISHQDSLRINKVYCGTGEGSMYLTSRN